MIAAISGGQISEDSACCGCTVGLGGPSCLSLLLIVQGCDTVRAVGPGESDGPNDLVVSLDRSDPTPGGRARVDYLVPWSQSCSRAIPGV